MVSKIKKNEDTMIINKKIYIISLSFDSFFIGILVSLCVCSFLLYIENHFNSISIINVLKMSSFYIMAIAWTIICFMRNYGLLLVAKTNK